LIFKFFPQHHLPRNRIFLSLAMPLFLRRTDAIICVSEHTKRDAVKLYQIDETKTHVIHEGIHPRFKQVTDLSALQRAKERYNLPDQFILAVGTIEPRKNLITLFEAFKALVANSQWPNLTIIVVGKQGWLFEETFRAVHERGLTGRVKFPGFVADEDLPAVYSLAKALAFPSVYEGFGFPPLEAMACGTPVLCSNTSSLPELVGQSALLLPPTDAAEWATALNQVLTDRGLALALRQRGPHQAAKYSWEKAAKETRTVYDQLLESG
jgi:glycosyltransferase involved in cell wall biosynthesis